MVLWRNLKQQHPARQLCAAETVDAPDAAIPEFVLPDADRAAAAPEDGDVRIRADGPVDPARPGSDRGVVLVERRLREPVRPGLEGQPRREEAAGDEDRQPRRDARR